ncbi:MAG: 2-dehydropantoate 2-reductase [Firmicutes bacterium]|nr:2-dehydropantoate 2-reductase [Bacillota bacterium]
MKIGIIGAGAMGSLFGARLADGDNQVTLIDVWREHVRKINAEGLRLVGENGEKIYHLRAVESPRSLGTQDLVIIFVKSYHTTAALKNAANLLGPNTAVLTLQNGLGNAELISEVAGGAAVYAGTTSHGAHVLGPALVRHAGEGETVIGRFGGPNDRRAGEIAAALTRCSLVTRVTDNIDGLIWDKLLVNVGINALTAICAIPNGGLVDLKSAGLLMEKLVAEAEGVARAKGIKLPGDNPRAKAREVAAATGENRSSMLQDMENRRRTEIDFINGAIVKEGAKVNVATPCNEMVALLIKTLEEKRSKGIA